jgi:ketosteroid isomerase-like protein
MTSTLDVGKQLVTFCQQGKDADAVDRLYADSIVSIEPKPGPDMPQRTQGIEAIRRKHEWWVRNHEVHKAEVSGPWPHGDRFIVRFKYDVSGKAGPMAGKRITMEEAGLYTVRDGKIVEEEFFYDMGQ